MDGFLFIDKPAGMTSHDVVDVVRRLTGERRVGHAGTLDPFATGLLILGVGKATKELGKLIGLNKKYEAVLMLGATSDTFDREGVITVMGRGEPMRSPSGRPEGRHVGLPLRDDIESTLDQFRGGYDQRAPIFSAKKIKGKKLYELARAGTATEAMRPIKRVIISSLHITHYAFPFLHLHIQCSSGTYIRSLADDIGRALGTGAYLTELRRTHVGDFSIEQAQTVEEARKNGLKLLSLDKSPAP